MTTPLKPCPNPWCNSSVLRVVEAHFGGGLCVCCKKCGLRTPWFTTKEKLLDVWNHRPGEQAVAEECARIAESAMDGIVGHEIGAKIRARFGGGA